MSEGLPRITDGSSDTMAPVISHQGHYDANVDYVINEYMERLGTRLNILETELKYAWRALDLLSQEYIKMWERLEKLEGLLYEQQSVISQLLDFYTSGGSANGIDINSGATTLLLDRRLGELQVIREILGNGAVEDGLEEGLDVTGHSLQKAIIQEIDLDASEDEINMPTEAFYKSLNQAYREDLVGCNSSISQLGLIWEEREDTDENNKKNELKELESESQEVYSAMDYKDYRGNSPCISEQDIAQLTRIDSIDHVTIEKLNELDRLSNKLQQDSANIKHLQRKLMESPLSINEIQEITLDNNEEEKVLDNQYKQMYSKDNWSFSNDIRDQEDLIMLAKSELQNSLSNVQYATRPSSRLSVTDSIAATDEEVAETLAGAIREPTSPRRRTLDVNTCSTPFTTVTGRLAYSNAVQHAESAEAAAAIHNSKNPFYCSTSDINSMMAASYEAISNSVPIIYNVRSEKSQSPTLSICSLRTRKDGYIGSADEDDNTNQYINATSAIELNSNKVYLGPSRSPRSPKTSPKRPKSHIMAAKSDSGLSSMSGWSSLEKSPGSPKNGSLKVSNLSHYYSDNSLRQPGVDFFRMLSPVPGCRSAGCFNAEKNQYVESETDSKIHSSFDKSQSNVILPGGHHLSAFTTVKSPCNLETAEGYGTFVPAPAPVSDINVSPRKKSKHEESQSNSYSTDHSYGNQQSGIYSVAGSNTHTYTSVYTSNSADYISQTMNYPDLIEPYEHNEIFNAQRAYAYNIPTTMSQTEAVTSNRRKSLSRAYSTSNESDGIANHEGYKTAMYRTMFPSGNITDALSYYPTSSRYESELEELSKNYNEPTVWAYGSSEKQPQNLQNYPREPDKVDYNSQQLVDANLDNQPIYENQQQINEYNQNYNQRQEIPYLELDLRNRNTPDYITHQLNQQHHQNQQQQQNDPATYVSNNVIMTQSGYITISSSMADSTSQDKKKIKRGNTLKSAMSSVSHWLPDLRLTKRNRSYSLPAGVHSQDVEKTKTAYVKSNVAPKKKKKIPIVSTVSGILQKAKKKAYHHHRSYSLSDPEHSDNDWMLDRASSVVSDDRSEDSYSIPSESYPDTSQDLFAKLSTNTSKPRHRKFSHQESLQKTINPIQFQTTLQETSSLDTESKNNVDFESINEEETSGKSTGSGTSSIFPTIGENKENKRSSGSSDKTDDTVVTEPKTKLSAGGSSMEFAVSRALGKYRQRYNSNNEEQTSDEQTVSVEEYTEEEENKNRSNNRVDLLVAQRSSESQTNGQCKSTSDNDMPVSEGSPSAVSLKSHFNRFLPRHQQSLDIPGHKPGEDDDNRSTHSWRSTSRVSSRRQSTEDSIDSEDEWYCYELKKLEEMERQSHLEVEIGETLREEPEPEDESVEEGFEPYEEVKEKMSFVLRELRMKAKVVEGVLDVKDNNLQVINSAKRRESRKSLEFDTSIFAKVTYIREEDQSKLTVKHPDEEHSSGDTSGPDSPHQSADEYDEQDETYVSGFPLCTTNQSVGSVSEDKPVQKRDSTISVPKIEISESQSQQDDQQKDDQQKESSKWKLLKALKERKAEEKNNQERVTETSSEKEKVSMLGMMQKFYEIHVRT